MTVPILLFLALQYPNMVTIAHNLSVGQNPLERTIITIGKLL